MTRVIITLVTSAEFPDLASGRWRAILVGMKNAIRILAVLLAGCAQNVDSINPESAGASTATAVTPTKALEPWMRNCVGATSLGVDPADGCDDGNPCTQDSIVNGACVHTIDGFGTTCSDDGLAACWGGQCCPAYGERVDCYAEGVQDACAAGSLCLEGRCWIACGEGEKVCASTEFPTCAAKSVGSVSIRICE